MPEPTYVPSRSLTTTRPLVSLACLGLALATRLTAQEPPRGATPDQIPDLPKLVAALARAHRPSGAAPPTESFRCKLELQLVDPTQKQGGQAALAVRFLRWSPPSSSRRFTLIRYEVRGGEERIVAGRDRDGPWHLVQGKPESLTAARFEADLEAFRERTNLARQLLRFLSPDQVVRSLKNPSDIARERLQVGTRPYQCLTISGDIDSFPRMREAGDDGPARLKLYIEQRTSRLLAVDAAPLVDDKPDTQRGERILLRRLHERDGVLVPLELVHLWNDEQGVPRPRWRIALPSIELKPDPPLTVDDFDRGDDK